MYMHVHVSATEVDVPMYGYVHDFNCMPYSIRMMCAFRYKFLIHASFCTTFMVVLGK